MKIYIDESGDFNSKEGKLNFYTSICMLSNDGKLELKKEAFLKWKNNIPNNFFNKKGEVKGSSLKPGQLLDFVNEILIVKPTILVRPFCINHLDFHAIEDRRKVNNEQISEGINIYEKQGKNELVNRYKKLRSWYASLSNEQYFKIEMLMLVIFETFYDFFICSVLNKFDAELGDLEIFVDIDNQTKLRR